MSDKVNINNAFGQFKENWRPKVVANLNGQEVKVVKIQGEFPWHFHADADEFFLCWTGLLRVEFRDRIVELKPGECLVIPRGIEHRSCATEPTEFVIFEPMNVLNTGNLGMIDTFTAPNGVAV